MDENIKYWLALRGIKGVGSAITKRLIKRFKDPAKIFSAPVENLLEVRGMTPKTAEAVARFKGWEGVDNEIAGTRRAGVSILSWDDRMYPKNLLSLHDPPVVIYLLGELKESDSMALAIVGSRNSSAYGLELTENFSYCLARAGVTIVSGMARGIDSVAHKGALKAGGRTIAVTGCGLDIVYPPENSRLFSDIKDGGAIISEFPLGTPPEPCNFPRRNRLISGLSLGVIVAEASLKSGSLITARYALEQGREVYAIPGNINSMKSRGTNSLIKEGARLVESPEEVLSDLLPQVDRSQFRKTLPPQQERFSLNEKEKNIYCLLGPEPRHIDELIKKCPLDVREIASVLLSLELMGAVTQHPGKLFTKRLN